MSPSGGPPEQAAQDAPRRVPTATAASRRAAAAEAATRQAMAAMAAGLVAWALPISGLLFLAAQPRWYVLDDGRETGIRIAFWLGLAAMLAAALLATVLGRRAARHASGTVRTRARLGRGLGVAMLVLGGVLLTGGLIALGSMDT